MFFVSVNLVAIGYTLIYAAIKGDAYTIAGVPVWRRPWLPFVDVFTRHALTQGAGPAVDQHQPPTGALAAI